MNITFPQVRLRAVIKVCSHLISMSNLVTLALHCANIGANAENGCEAKAHSHLASTSAFACSKIIEAMVTKHKCKELVLYPFSVSMSTSP